MSFQQGLSGLSASSKQLDVIGNNIANVATVGFKSSQVQFSDVFANSISGTGVQSSGIGVRVSAVATEFTQGNFTTTSNPLDVGITGRGQFILDDNGLSSYSRAGQFQVNKNGFIVSNTGSQLMGYMPDSNGKIDNSKLQALRLSYSELPPRATDELTIETNLDSNTPTLTTAGFNPTAPSTYQSSTGSTIYDSLGKDHATQVYYVKTASNNWSAFATVDGVQVAGPGPNNSIGDIVFTTSGALDTTASTIPMTISATTTNGSATLSLELDVTGTTQFGTTFSINGVNQNGYQSARMNSFAITLDGTVQGSYSNGKTYGIAQIALADFRNQQGLKPVGNNAWVETGSSGAPVISTPSSSGLGGLQAGTVEDSNVDLTAEMVNMITAQRMYQANANSIKTQDQVLQTLVNLKQ